MAKTRDNYHVTGNTVQELAASLNFLLQRIADRLDKLEGIRGTAAVESDLEIAGDLIAGADLHVLDSEDNIIHSME